MPKKVIIDGKSVKVFLKLSSVVFAAGGIIALTGCGTDAPEPLYLEEPEERPAEEQPLGLPAPAGPTPAEPAPTEPAPLEPAPVETEVPETGLPEWQPDVEEGEGTDEAPAW